MSSGSWAAQRWEILSVARVRTTSVYFHQERERERERDLQSRRNKCDFGINKMGLNVRVETKFIMSNSEKER